MMQLSFRADALYTLEESKKLLKNSKSFCRVGGVEVTGKQDMEGRMKAKIDGLGITSRFCSP